MKKIYFFLIILIFFTSCSSKNAFTPFDVQKDKELALNSLRTVKILDKDSKLEGVFSSIYLNQIYPETYNEDEYFFIYFYTKTQEESINIKLGDETPLEISKLSENNKFSDLVDVKSSWNKYYIVRFRKNNKLQLTFETSKASATVIHSKEH